MKRNGWIMGGAALLVLATTACGSQPSQTAATDGPIPEGEGGLTEPAPAEVPDGAIAAAPDVLPPSNTAQPLPPPLLLPPTTASQRLPDLDPGRADPFAPLITSPRVVATSPALPPAVRPTAPIPASPDLPPAPFAATPIPVQPPAPGPGLETDATSDAASPVAPGEPAPSLPAPRVPDLLAEAIEVSGVIEIGGRTNIIVKVPNERTSRHVGVGETLANGQVLFKRVESSPGGDPVIILEQNGREVIRLVGGASMVGMDGL